MSKTIIYKEVEISRTEEGYWAFTDKEGRQHIRNPKVRGGTLSALKGDIDYYKLRGWV